MLAMELVERNGYSTFDQTDKTTKGVSTDYTDNHTAAKLAQDGATYTIDEAIEKVGFGRFQIKLSIVAGLAWMTDSMELMVLSILGPVLVCQWQLSSTQEALISTVVFLGLVSASPLLGWLADQYGRRTSLMISVSWAAFYGMLSAASPLYLWLLVLRGLTGMGLGGVSQAVTYYTEFLPSKTRGKCILLLEVFWTLGTMFEVIMAILILQPLGWNWWLAASSIPLIIYLPLCLALPESPHYMIASGRLNEAQKTLEEIAKCNKSTLPRGKLKATAELPRARFKDLFAPEYRISTPLLWIIWFSVIASYYGIILLTTELINSDTPCVAGNTMPMINPGDTCRAGCKTLTLDNYKQLLWISAAELPGLALTAIYIDCIGRKTAMMINFFLFSLFVFALLICANRTFTIVMLFLARAVISPLPQLAYIYTPELYPTVIRALGMGIATSFAKSGAIVAPFLSQVLIRTSLTSVICVYGGLSILGFIATMLLPIETRGREMQTNVR